jgi:hypothetical protein
VFAPALNKAPLFTSVIVYCTVDVPEAKTAIGKLIACVTP